MKKWIGLLIALLLLTAADQGTKLLAVHALKDGTTIPIIPGVFELAYVENRGAAFGILQGQRWFFLIATLVFFAVFLKAYSLLPRGKRYYPVHIAFALLFAGALGNLIDRMFRRYVVDFLYFKLIDFPVFNVADCYVVVGSFLLALLLLVQRDLLDHVLHKDKEAS